MENNYNSTHEIIPVYKSPDFEQFEYKVESRKLVDFDEDYYNLRGKEGWELIIFDNRSDRIIWKRKIK